jgi:transglutaminase-like putative cysteine protease
MAEYIDCFGNPVTYLAIQEPHGGLVVDSELEIEQKPITPIDPASTPPWEELRDRIAGAVDHASRRAAAVAYASPRIPPLPALAAYAAPSFVAGIPIGVAATALMERIHQDFVFDPTATTVTTPLDKVLTTRRGVCQDFAHLQIGCLRALGLAARYVSGYLHTMAPPGAPRLQGADVSHAWLAVWCGGDTWLDLDPTNNKIATAEYITLAWGRDYEDVSPVRGVLFGGGANALSVKVDVESLSRAGGVPG